MPVYEYKCCHCPHVTERLRKFEEKQLTTECEQCGHTANNIEVSATNFALKGGGWYKDGYSSTKEKK